MDVKPRSLRQPGLHFCVLVGAVAVAEVVMRHPSRLRPAQSLNLRLLVYAEHDSVLGWIEIQADVACDLLHKERIGGELVAVRLGREGFPPAVNGGF